MRYEIQSKSDFQVGATLIVRMPEEELDRKALRTIQLDCPGFLLPFRYRLIDGDVELTYQIGNRSKIAYLSGKRTPAEYADMWSGLLQPLLDCGDWFMRPESFVLSPEYLYCEKSIQAIRFVYIPSMLPSSDGAALKSLVTDIAKMNHVTDVDLENKVIWAIQDFNIHNFLQLMRESKASEPSVSSASGLRPDPVAPSNVEWKSGLSASQSKGWQPNAVPIHGPVDQRAGQLGVRTSEDREQPDQAVFPQSGKTPLDGDIQIQFPIKEKTEKERKPKGGLFGPKREKEEKPKSKSGIWGKKKGSKEIVGGAAAQLFQPQQFEPTPAPSYTPSVDDGGDDITVVDQMELGGTRFRYVGASGHPQFIEISVDPGAVFTIGRFDESVGVRQSNFEFPKKTKAVSRRHAAVERRTDGYYIVDLGSSAGTFLNGQKLPPNAPFRLERGCRISFGFSGADYMWEEADI